MSRWLPVLRRDGMRLTITILYPHTETYVDVPGYAPWYATLSELRRGPGSLGGRSRGSGRSFNRSLTRSEINEVLRGATSKIVGDLTQEI